MVFKSKERNRLTYILSPLLLKAKRSHASYLNRLISPIKPRCSVFCSKFGCVTNIRRVGQRPDRNQKSINYPDSSQQRIARCCPECKKSRCRAMSKIKDLHTYSNVHISNGVAAFKFKHDSVFLEEARNSPPSIWVWLLPSRHA